MPVNTRSSPGRRGIALLGTALALFGLIPVFGLAIDTAFLYVVRARLSAAADASVLAAARSESDTSQAASRAEAYFRANFPEGFLDTTHSQVEVSVSEGETPGNHRVSVTASVEAPLLFFQALGFHQTTIRVHSAARAGESGPRLVG